VAKWPSCVVRYPAIFCVQDLQKVSRHSSTLTQPNSESENTHMLFSSKEREQEMRAYILYSRY
jgi:hypothetical protein